MNYCALRAARALGWQPGKQISFDLLDFACAGGAIKCVGWLLNESFPATEDALLCAIMGGNSGIIQ
jgi:hypothetical protein